MSNRVKNRDELFPVRCIWVVGLLVVLSSCATGRDASAPPKVSFDFTLSRRGERFYMLKGSVTDVASGEVLSGPEVFGEFGVPAVVETLTGEWHVKVAVNVNEKGGRLRCLATYQGQTIANEEQELAWTN